MFTHPVLLGDIGGTNARFAVLTAPGEPAIPLPGTLTSRHAGPVEAIRSVLAGQSVPRPRSAFIAVATRVDSPAVRLTNAPWLIDAAEMGSQLGLSRVVFVNDYVPVAASLPGLREGHGGLARLGPDVQGDGGAMVVLGPGTGLGAAALLPFGERLVIQSTEAAHVDFGPDGERETALWSKIDRVGGRITAETLLSGPGLLRLYRACAATAGRAAPCATPEAVTAAASAGTDDLARDAVRLFGRLLGRFAGDLALVFGSTGGVFVSGGIAPTMLEALKGSFRPGFEAKAPYTDLMRHIPAWVIMRPAPAFEGLSAIVSQPDRFLFAQQTWAGQ